MEDKLTGVDLWNKEDDRTLRLRDSRHVKLFILLVPQDESGQRIANVDGLETGSVLRGNNGLHDHPDPNRRKERRANINSLHHTIHKHEKTNKM